MPIRFRLGRIERYVLRELLAPLVLTFVVASVLLASGQILRDLVDKWLNRGLGTGLMLQTMVYFFPPLFLYTLPVALLLAVLIAFGRLSEDHEIVAMQAAGVSWNRLFGPVLIVGLLAATFNCWLANAVLPRFRYQQRAFLVRTVTTHPTLLLEAQTWLPRAHGMHVWIGAIDDAKGELRDLRIYRDDGDGGRQVITAASGRIEIPPGQTNVLLELRDGTLHESNSADAQTYNVMQFRTLRIPFPVYALQYWARRAAGTRNSERGFGPLLRELRAASAEGRSTRKLWREIGNRTAMPFACLTFVLVGAPLGIRPHKSIHAYGAGVCIGLAVTFYLLYTIGQVLSRQGLVHPLIGLWTPNFLLGGVGAGAMIRQWRR